MSSPRHVATVTFVRSDGVLAAGWVATCSCGEWQSRRVSDNNYAKALWAGHRSGAEVSA